MKILKNIGLAILAGILGYVFGTLFGKIYFSFIQYYGSFLFTKESAGSLIGFPMGILFFLPLFFTIFGDRHKYWWIGIAAIPAAAFLIYFDLDHVHFHVLFPIAGWLIGYGISVLIHRQTLNLR